MNTPTFPIKENYLAMIEGSIGTPMFRHLYQKKDDVVKDILRDGQVSCAFHTSLILCLPNITLLPQPHATVEGLIKRLDTTAGWEKLPTPEHKGDIIIWEKQAQKGGEPHLHAGFYWNEEEAISHLDFAVSPQKHHLTFGVKDDEPVRRILAAYTNSAFH